MLDRLRRWYDTPTGRTTVAHGAAGLALMLVAGVALHAVTGPFDVVRSSTGAWLMAHVQRVMLADSYAAAAVASEIPNTYYNPLYPAGVAWLAGVPPTRWLGGPVVVAHVVSACSLGLAALPLFALWRGAGGRLIGVVGASALLFPPMIATAGLVRYDTTAIALALLCAWAAWGAQRPVAGPAGSPAAARLWWIAGALAGLVYNTREFLAAPAAGALAVALGLVVLRRWRAPGGATADGGRGSRAWSRWRDPLRALGGVLGGGLLGVCVLPVLLRLSPLGGVDALLNYSVTGDVVQRPGQTMAQTLYLHTVGVPLAMGLAGWIAVAVRLRGQQRAAVVVLLGLLAPFAVFLASAQQSAQYYLLGHVLTLSGIAGLVRVLPWPRLRQLAVAGLAVALWLWTTHTVPDLRVGQVPPYWELHTESWPAPAEDIAGLADWAQHNTGELPMIVVSHRIENADALVTVRHGRPTAYLFPDQLEMLPRLVALYEGRDVVLFSVESHLGRHPETQVGSYLGTLGNERVSGVLYRLPGLTGVETGRCPAPGAPRGACMQRDWVIGGDAHVRQRMLQELQKQRGLLRWNRGKPSGGGATPPSPQGAPAPRPQ